LSAQSPIAQTRTVIAGKPFNLHFCLSDQLRPQFFGRGRHPRHFAARQRQHRHWQGLHISEFSGINVRSACNRRNVPGTIATYTARRGFTGPDFFSLEVIYPSGQQQQASYHLMDR
jgi:hypothetical protein